MNSEHQLKFDYNKLLKEPRLRYYGLLAFYLTFIPALFPLLLLNIDDCFNSDNIFLYFICLLIPISYFGLLDYLGKLYKRRGITSPDILCMSKVIARDLVDVSYNFAWTARRAFIRIFAWSLCVSVGLFFGEPISLVSALLWFFLAAYGPINNAQINSTDYYCVSMNDLKEYGMDDIISVKFVIATSRLLENALWVFTIVLFMSLMGIFAYA